MNMEIE